MSLIDEAAVQRAVDGDKTVALTPEELRAAWRELQERGHGTAACASTLGVPVETIARWQRGLPTTTGRTGAQVARPASSTESTPSATTPATSPAPTPSTTDGVIAAGLASTSKRIAGLAKKISEQIVQLRELLDHDAERVQAEAEVQRLERQLAEAKARLEGRSPRVARSTSPKAAAPSGADVWAWAREQGLPTKPGRPPKALVEQYVAARAAS